MKKRYVCKQHGYRCRSYVQDVVDELNKGRKPTEADLKLVKEVKGSHKTDYMNKKEEGLNRK